MANEFRIKNGLIVEGIDEVGSDTDKFLMSDSGKLKYVTGANLRSYIGAGTSSTDGISFDGSTANGVLTYKDADEATVESNLTFDGSALQLTGTLTVGVDDTGHDVKFFGATAGAYMLYDQSEDHLLIHGPNDVLLKLNDGNDSGSHMTIAGARAKVGYSGNNLFLQGSSSKGVAFGVNNGTFGSGEVARFDTSGNFGIGTTSPSGRLHVETTNTYTNGISGATAYFKAINTQSSAGYPMTLVLDSDWTGSGTGNDDVRTRYLNAGVQKWQHNVGSNLVWYYDTSGDNSGSWSERMTFTSAGALSVDSDITSGGTITADAADIGYIQIRSNNEIETDSSSIFLQYNTGNDVEVGSTGTNADLVVIGRVGIAPGERLNTPSAPLHINGGSGEAMPLRLERATAGGADYGVGLEFVLGETGDANAERVYAEIVGCMDGASGNAAGGSAHDGYLTFRPSLNGTPTERMRILSGGNVGIGTTSPAAKLTVAGSAYLQTASANLNFRIHADTDSSPAPRIEMMRGAHDTWGTGDNYNDWRIENINHLKFYSGTSSVSSGAAVERFEILSDGSGITNNNAYVIPGSAGTSGQVLKWPSSGTVLEWADESGGGGGSLDADTNLASNPTWTVTSTSGIGLELTRNQSSSNMDNDLFRIREDSQYSDQAALRIIHDGFDQLQAADYGKITGALIVGSNDDTIQWPMTVGNHKNHNGDGYGVGIKLKLSGWGSEDESDKWAGIGARGDDSSSWGRPTGMMFWTRSSTTSGTTPTEKMYLDGGGQLGIGVTAPSHIIHVDGQGRATNSAWATSSDMRVKENIVELDSSLDVINSLRPVKFDYIDGAKDQINFIAQEFKEVIPDAVTLTEEQGLDDFHVLDTSMLVPMLVKAVQELTTKVEELEARLDG